MQHSTASVAPQRTPPVVLSRRGGIRNHPRAARRGPWLDLSGDGAFWDFFLRQTSARSPISGWAKAREGILRWRALWEKVTAGDPPGTRPRERSRTSELERGESPGNSRRWLSAFGRESTRKST